jgi:hemerythrin-like domain-containing protein
MTESKAPNIARDLIRIHSIITRSLEVAIENSEPVAERGLSDGSTREGYLNFLRAFVSVLNAHHLLEDELAFPYLRDKFLGAPYDLLMPQHRVMVPILDEIKGTIEAAAKAHPSERSYTFYDGLTRIADIWRPHIRIEEGHFTVEKAAELISQEEHARLGRMFTEHSQSHSGPDYLVMPFLLYNLTREERAVFPSRCHRW